jgi:hypothetical protein
MPEPPFNPDPGPCPAATNEAAPAPVRTREQVAEQLRDTSSAMFLYGSLRGVFPDVDALTYRMYRDALIVDAGDPRDPIEGMLIEACALAHFNCGRLIARSASATDLESSKAFGALAVAMLGELRRTAVALAAYRAASGGRATTAPAGPARGARDIELGGKRRGGDGEDERVGEEPASDRGGAGERPEEPRPDRGRPRTAPHRRVG